jgi:hypothetical protein
MMTFKDTEEYYLLGCNAVHRRFGGVYIHLYDRIASQGRWKRYVFLKLKLSLLLN